MYRNHNQGQFSLAENFSCILWFLITQLFTMLRKHMKYKNAISVTLD